MVSIKFKTNYIRFIYRLKGGSMKKCNMQYIGATIFVSDGLYPWPSNNVIRRYNQLEILPYFLHFIEVLKRMLIIKYFAG